ncbi:MAG: sel1 repeat family protein [Parachlamydiaceae bacterium]|nr:MAG: sel1 repeat family protein [Parachlamydiaceae bacterium]
MAINPLEYTRKLWHDHDQGAKQTYQNIIDQQRLHQEKTQFETAKRIADQDPNNLQMIKMTADCYSLGRGVVQNETLAMSYYKKAAKLNDVQSMTTLGVFYLREENQNYNKAFKWLLKASEQGEDTAMSSLALCYEKGWGVHVDLVQSAVWCQKGADRGNPAAMLMLAVKYFKGLGVEQNKSQVNYWLRQGAAKDDPTCKAYLSAFLVNHSQFSRHPNEWFNFQNKEDHSDFIKALSILC